MATNNKPQAKTPNNLQNTKKHHYIRTTFATLFGMLALVFVLLSTLVVGVNRTLTNTQIFTNAVAPAFQQAELQGFVADAITDSLLKEAPVDEVASKLLPSEKIAGKTPEQLKELVKPEISSSVKQVLSSKAFTSTVSTLVQQTHAQAMTQLKGEDGNLQVNFTPVINAVLDELKNTKLSFVSEKVEIEPDQGRVTIKSDQLDKARDAYDKSQQATLALLGLTALFIALCVLISTHHMRTFRRVLASSGIVLLLIALALYLPSKAPLDSPDLEQAKAAIAVADVVLRDFRTNTLIVGLVLILVAVTSKVYDHLKNKHR